MVGEKLTEKTKQTQPLTEEDLKTPVMTYGQYVEGQSLIRKFLKEIKIKRTGSTVTTTYIWKLPDEIIAKNFALSMKEQFEQQLGGET